MEITKDTKVSDILREYGDIAEVMEMSARQSSIKTGPALSRRSTVKSTPASATGGRSRTVTVTESL